MLKPESDVPPDRAVDGYGVGDHVLVARDPGLAPGEAVIVATNHARPHLVKVKYLQLRGGGWIARKRILARVTPPVPRGDITTRSPDVA